MGRPVQRGDDTDVGRDRETRSKFIADDVARHDARKVARMRGMQVEQRKAADGAATTSPELGTLEDEVDRLTIAMLDERSSLHEEPTGGGPAREPEARGPSRTPSPDPS